MFLNFLRKLNRARWYYTQLYTVAGEYELRFLKHLIRPGSTVVDVGANAGIYSFHAKRYAAKVYAFEPNYNFHNLLRRLGIKVILQDAALSDYTGIGDLTIPSGESEPAHGWGTLEPFDGSVAEKRSVSIRTLDSYNLSPSFIKIDVEGHEFSVLKGAIETLQRSRPNLIVECEDRHRIGATSQLFRMMEGLGYRGFFFRERSCYSTSAFVVARDQGSVKLFPGQHLIRQKYTYVNNFIFVAQEKQIPSFLNKAKNEF